MRLDGRSAMIGMAAQSLEQSACLTDGIENSLKGIRRLIQGLVPVERHTDELQPTLESTCRAVKNDAFQWVESDAGPGTSVTSSVRCSRDGEQVVLLLLLGHPGRKRRGAEVHLQWKLLRNEC